MEKKERNQELTGIRLVRPYGNGAHVVVPKKDIGKRVKVTEVKE